MRMGSNAPKSTQHEIRDPPITSTMLREIGLFGALMERTSIDA